MKKRVLILAITILLIQQCIADCSDNQININSASKEELDKIIWVGPATADKIIAARTFNSVDDLIKVSGIGEIRLADIKKQGLACVEEEEEEKETKEDKNDKDNNETIEKVDDKTNYTKNYEENNEIENIKQDIKLEVIKLNTKDIKTEDVKENLDTNNYARYGFVAFCILLGFLFIIKRNKEKKNEFR